MEKKGLSRKFFGIFTIALSIPYVYLAIFLALHMINLSEAHGYKVTKAMFYIPLFPGLLFLARTYIGVLLLQKELDHERFRFVFTLVCFFEAIAGSVILLSIVREYRLMGNIVTLSLLLYYICAFPFIRRNILYPVPKVKEQFK